MTQNPQTRGAQEGLHLLKALIVVPAYVCANFAVSWLAVDLICSSRYRPIDLLVANLLLSLLFGFRIKDLFLPNWVSLGLFFLSAIPIIKALTSVGWAFRIEMLSSQPEAQFSYLVFVSSAVCCGFMLLAARAARLWHKE